MPNISKSEHGLVADEDLYATADGRLVGAEDPAAAELVSRAGTPIREKLVERFGLKSGEVKAGTPAEKGAAHAGEKPAEKPNEVLGEGAEDPGGAEIKRRKIGSPQGK